MDGNIPPDSVSGLVDAIDRGAGLPWTVIGAASGSIAMLVLLTRYAIDLLAPLSVLVLATHTVRDTFLDWCSGESYVDEPDPVWAVGAVVMSLAGTTVGVAWLLSTSPWAIKTGAYKWLPPAIVRVATAAETYGWGRRVVLAGGPVAAPQASPAPREAMGQPGRSGDRGVDATARIETPGAVDHPTGTAGDAQGPTQSSAAARPPTSTTISSSATIVRVGSRVQIDARVLSSAGRPSGTVVFRDGSVVVGSAGLDDGGRATVAIGSLAVGSHAITAEFTPSPAFLGSRSGVQIVVVIP